MMSLRSAAPALAAALLFGASTPLAKLLLGALPPLLLAGLLYLGSGLGLGLLLLLRAVRSDRSTADPDRGSRPFVVAVPPRQDWPWLLAAIAFGGLLGPALLMAGLARGDSATAALLLNVEGVFTALIAWLAFRENADRQVVLGMAAIVAGGLLLAWQPGGAGWSAAALLVIGACLCWALDNNLTRQVSTHDAMLIAGLKGGVAGLCNTALALFSGADLPAGPVLAASLVLGFLGYGLSLTLFVVSLRTVGTARTGAYFSVAPLFGVLISLVLWPEVPSPLFWPAAVLMAIGVWLHLRERHDHEHHHEVLEHAHPHRHDLHHQHDHDFAWSGDEPHVHPHRHAALTHRHPHHPDIHHRHRHRATGTAACGSRSAPRRG